MSNPAKAINILRKRKTVSLAEGELRLKSSTPCAQYYSNRQPQC